MDEEKIKEENGKEFGHEKDTPAPEEFKIEQEWADRLGMGFDPEQAAESMKAPQPDEMPPMYGPAGNNNAPVPPAPPMRQMPPTYLVWAIISTLCCCMPAGIVAIVFSSMVSSRFYARDYEGAAKASRNAEIWIIVSIVAGVVSNALYFPLMLLLPS